MKIHLVNNISRLVISASDNASEKDSKGITEGEQIVEKCFQQEDV